MLLRIKNLRLQTVIGIHAWEHDIDRQIIINAEIETKQLEALHSDNIEDAIDYHLIVDKIKATVARKRFKLVEKMAQEIMNEIMSDKRIHKCKLEIDKVGPLESLESFSIIIEQKNGL